MTSVFRPVAILLAVSLLITLSAPAQARDLAGRLFFGTFTQLHLQEDESFLTEMLRAVKVVNRELPVLNLNSIAIQNDYVFVAEDHELYYIDMAHRDRILHIGTAEDLSNIKLFDGVTLKAVENINANFESGQRELALKVVVSKEMEAAAPGTTRAKYSHWLNELDTIWDETLMTEGAKRNYTILMNALSSALPDGENEDPRAFEHLKLVKKYIEAGTFPAKEPLQQLIDVMIKRVKANLEDEETSQAAKDVLPAYEKLNELLEKGAN